MFKTLFCHSERLYYGSKLLSYFIDVPYEEILSKISLKNTELNKDSVLVKNERCDYVAQIEDTLLNVEVNCSSDKETMLRNIEYVYRLFSNKIKVGSDYKYSKVVQFNLNNFSFVGHDKIMDVYSFQNDEKLRLANDMIIVIIYVPNIVKKCYTEGVDSLTEMEKFILALATEDKRLSNEIVKGDKFMQELVEKQEEFTLSDDLRESYDHELAMKKWGHEVGYQEGIEQTKKESAIEFHKNGVSDELIINSLHITKEKLNEYLNSEKS